MNNKYSVACITLVREKYKINTDGICVVYTAYSIRDSIRTPKNDSQVPKVNTNDDNNNKIILNDFRGSSFITIDYGHYDQNYLEITCAFMDITAFRFIIQIILH